MAPEITEILDGVDASSRRHHSANTRGQAAERGEGIHGRSYNNRC